MANIWPKITSGVGQLLLDICKKKEYTEQQIEAVVKWQPKNRDWDKNRRHSPTPYLLLLGIHMILVLFVAGQNQVMLLLSPIFVLLLSCCFGCYCCCCSSCRCYCWIKGSNVVGVVADAVRSVIRFVATRVYLLVVVIVTAFTFIIMMTMLLMTTTSNLLSLLWTLMLLVAGISFVYCCNANIFIDQISMK